MVVDVGGGGGGSDVDNHLDVSGVDVGMISLVDWCGDGGEGVADEELLRVMV